MLPLGTDHTLHSCHPAVDFSDPQGGKGPADRMSATCKNHIRLYINEGHDVTMAEEMRAALLSHGRVDGVRVAVVKSQMETSPLEKAKIPGVNKLNNFQFDNEGIRAKACLRCCRREVNRNKKPTR